jgi:hypothetical protein
MREPMTWRAKRKATMNDKTLMPEKKNIPYVAVTFPPNPK